jgi:hypothetical protein
MASLTTALKLMNLVYGESGAYGYTNWGDLTDANHDIIENALTGQSAITVTTADVTLTDTQHVSLHLNLSGLLTGNRSIILKASQPGMWFVSNGTTGSYTVTVKPSGGTGVVVDQGKKAVIYSDGTNAIAIYDAGDFYTATEIDSLITSESVEVSDDFVATGSITTGNFVALRSDGTVEAVTGTEAVAAIGSDATVTAVTSMRFIHGAYNATAGKLAAIFYDLGASNTIYIVIGTLSGSTIAWGTPQTFTGGTGATYWTRGSIVFNAAGTAVIASFEGASGYQSFVAATISGTVLTFGSVVQNGTVAHDAGNIRNYGLLHDDTHGTRFVFAQWATTSNILAGTYSGTTITLGTSQAFALTDTSRVCVHYDATNTRLILTSGSGTNSYVRAATVSGTTWTAGAEASTASILRIISTIETTSGKVALFGVSSESGAYGPAAAAVATFSGATSTINTVVQANSLRITTDGATARTLRLSAAYEPTSGKCLFLNRLTDFDTTTENQADLALFIGTISGTTITFGDPGLLRSTNVGRLQLAVRGSNSEVMVLYSNESDFGRVYALTGKITSGAWVEGDNTLTHSTLPTSPEPTGAYSNDTDFDLLCGWTLVNFNRFGVTGASTTLTTFALVLPTESTNANDWIGVSRDTVTNGQTATIRMRGGKASGLSGLAANTNYYLKGDGTLITTDNGRPAGRALASTKMLLVAL